MNIKCTTVKGALCRFRSMGNGVGYRCKYCLKWWTDQPWPDPETSAEMDELLTLVKSKRMKKRLQFWMPERGMSRDDAYEYDTDKYWHVARAAEDFASYFHSHLGGVEASWPMEIHVGDPNGDVLGSVSVDRGIVAYFVGKEN